MSITDELRHNIEGAEQLYGCECKHLLDIADRIDAAVKGMVELPKDADDVPWHVGERDEDGNVVTELRLTYDGCWFVITDGEWPYRPKRKRHYHAPNVEDVVDKNAKLRELATYALKHIIEFECEVPDREMLRGKPCEDCADYGSSDCPKCMPRMFDVSGIEVDE